MRHSRLARAALVSLAIACSNAPPPLEAPHTETSVTPRSAATIRTISIVGTNDLHGRIEALPILGGYVDNLRAARRNDGAVLLLDAGDMFQGTLESNLTEGAVVIDAYAELGYTAAAIGNHELDFGPSGDSREGDQQGALKERILQARFPILSANLIEKPNGQPVDWKKLRHSVLVEIDGTRIGVIGALTEETPAVVMPALFVGLDVAPIAKTVEREARALRQRGAELVVLVAHAGGACKSFDSPRDSSSCAADAEIVRVVRALPGGLVDVVVAGHTHQGMAHFFGSTAVVEAYAYGRAFSRVDVRLGGTQPELEIHPPRELCPDEQSFESCTPGDYAGAPVRRNPRVQAIIAPALARAADKRREPLGVDVVSPIRESFGEPSALGNLFADLLRESVPKADAAIMNGGGLRAPLPAGPLVYGALHEAMPFDNTLAVVRLTGAELATVIAAHLGSATHGILSVSGLKVTARCTGKKLEVELFRDKGPKIRDDEVLAVVVSDYLATGGDELLAPARPAPDRIQILPELIRDAMAARLRARGRSLDGSSAALLDPKRPRIAFPGKRPVRCG